MTKPKPQPQAQPQAAAEQPASPAPLTGGARKSATTVTVACKVPTGVRLQLCKQTKYWEDTPSGPRERTRWDRFGTQHVVRGTAYPMMPPKGFRERAAVTSGYAITRGIPADFWGAWLEQNAKSDLVRSQMIFAFPDADSVREHAGDRGALLSGLEPLDMEPDKDGRVADPRVPRSTTTNVGDIAPAEVGA